MEGRKARNIVREAEEIKKGRYVDENQIQRKAVEKETRNFDRRKSQ